MPSQRILFLAGSRLAVFSGGSGQIAEDTEFSLDADGIAAFAAYLNRNQECLYHLLVDSAEEAFHLETIPPVSGSDRRALIERRLGQYFYGTPLRLAVSYGRNRAGRRDESILFAALTDPEGLAPWLDTLRSSGVPFVGLYSTALVLGHKRLPAVPETGRCLLLSIASGGLRQTYFVDGRVHFSRLAAMPAQDGNALAQTCASETSKTVQYLRAQRLADRSTLKVIVLSPAKQSEKLRQYCVDSDEACFEFVDASSVAANTGLKTALHAPRIDTLLAHLLLTHRPPVQFAPSAARATYTLWRARFGLRAASAITLAAVFSLGARLWLQANELREETSQLVQQTVIDTQRYDQLLATLPSIPLTSDNLRAVLAAYDQLRANDTDIIPMLVHLGTALEEMPRIELLTLDWKVGGQRNIGIPPTSLAMVMEVRARLPAALAGDQRAQLSLIDDLAERLGRNSYRAEILRTPVNIESGRTLRSDENDRDPDTRADLPRLSFDLRVSRALVSGSTP